MRSAISFLLLAIIAFSSAAQDDKESWWKDKFEARGYLRDMHILNVFNSDSSLTDNFLHNRLNFRFYPTKNLTAGLEVRNRFFWGETKQTNPFYSAFIDRDPGLVDMSFSLYESKAFFLHSTIDRLWFDYSDEKWNLRLGRQRINWGMNLVWNPNDLFNVYNFADFDYSERPGSDAVKIQRYFKKLRSLELVYKFTGNFNKDVFALKYAFNARSYDVQLIGAKYERDLSLAMGWAGNLKNAGFKGEASYFHPYENLLDTSGLLVFSSSVDYTFSNETYLNVSVFFNSDGADSPKALDNPILFSGTPSAKNLMPSQFAWFAQYSGPITPLLNAGGAVIYAQGINILFLTPNLGYSISETWDIGIFGQTYFGSMNGPFRNLGNSIYLRTQWSF